MSQHNSTMYKRCDLNDMSQHNSTMYKRCDLNDTSQHNSTMYKRCDTHDMSQHNSTMYKRCDLNDMSQYHQRDEMTGVSSSQQNAGTHNQMLHLLPQNQNVLAKQNGILVEEAEVTLELQWPSH